MTFTDYNDPKKSLVLFGLQNKFDFFYNLFKQEKLPHVLMLTGKKGVGKFTLINHLLTYIFDSNHYDLKNYKINDKSYFYKQYINNSFSNTIILSGNNFKTVSIEGIRALKSKILNPPWPEYTKLLLSSVPEMDPNWLTNLLSQRK